MHSRILHHGTTDSTSERAFAALADGSARHGDVHVAEAQSRGRGRLGRAWHSALGEGLYMSVVLLPERPLPPAALTIAAGLAVHDAVTALGVVDARLKWPNDVVVPTRATGVGPTIGADASPHSRVVAPTDPHSRAGAIASTSGSDESRRRASVTDAAKLSGILVETRGLSLDRPHYVVGVGVNVGQRSFPPELTAERPVTSLALCGVVTRVEDVLAAILAALPARLEAIEHARATLTRDYARATGLVSGVRVEVDAGDEPCAGTLRELDLDRGVLVQCDDGGERVFPLEIVRALRAVGDGR